MNTLWLTRIRPDLRSREVRSDLGNPVSLHRRVMTLYPHGLGEEARRQLGVLFRSDEGADGPQLLIQSRVQPDLEKLPRTYGAGVSKPLTPLLEALQPGLPIRYRIAANAVRKPGKSTREIYKLGSIIPLTGAAAEEWWIRQAETAGLKIHSVHSIPLDTAHCSRGTPQGRGAKPSQAITLARTRFEGSALIQDAALLCQRLADGIGRGKAYGCGLLSIAPVRHLS